MKKIFFYLIILTLNYILLTTVVFIFSYISLINGKTYDLFWIKSIQERLYTRGLRNIWQLNKNCVTFDSDLLYSPKDGKCEFVNPEFNTTLTFKDKIRLNKEDDGNFNGKNSITLIGDSIAMGWGVNDNQTFSYLLQKKLKKKVFNQGVSSYGTVREIKKLVSSRAYTKSNIILIQYHHNDIFENNSLDINKRYSMEEYEKKLLSNSYIKNNFYFFFKTFKSSLRLFFSDIKNKLNPENSYYYIDFQSHQIYLEKLIYENLDVKNKRVIVLFIKDPNYKIFNFPKSENEIEYILINLNKEDFFIIDEHPNLNGHKKIAEKIYEYIK